MKIYEDYILSEREVRYKDKDALAAVKIIKGQYENVEFNFGEIHVDENEEENTCTMRFNYDILSDHKELDGNKEFEVVLGEIMNDILMESLNAAEEKYKNELRAENTKAPTD